MSVSNDVLTIIVFTTLLLNHHCTIKSLSTSPLHGFTQVVARCVACAGFSVGEITALIFSRAISLEEGKSSPCSASVGHIQHTDSLLPVAHLLATYNTPTVNLCTKPTPNVHYPLHTCTNRFRFDQSTS